MGALLDAQLARRGIDPANLPKRSKLGKLTRRDGVPDSAELRRILSIPRRQWWTDPITPHVVREMTDQFRTPRGTMVLLPHQAWGLLEAIDHRALYGPIPVGEGKTLLSYLLALTGPYARPMLILPANLVGKTQREFHELSYHWRGPPVCVDREPPPAPRALRIVSAELIGHPTAGPTLLETYMPDVLMFDEAHMFKNLGAARTRRVDVYIDKYHPVCFVLSGTPHEASLKDFAHLQRWALPAHLRFLPAGAEELDSWAQALDTDVEQRLGAGALARLTRTPNPKLPDIRKGLADRIRETPGVISVSSEGPACSILLEADVFQNYGPAVDDAFETLASGETTDGWPVKEAVVQYMHQWQYCLGYESYWDPRPPDDWRDAYREWSRQCRDILAEQIEGIDSPMMVANAIDRGEFDAEALSEWRRLKPTFTPNVKARFIDDAMITHAGDWLESAKGKGVLWTRHVPFGTRLSKATGIPYFGAEGKDAKGKSIETHTGPAILSIAANKAGRNLQDRYDRCYIVDPFGTSNDAQQIIGRFHRRGQKADVVQVKVLIACLSHFNALTRARARATNVSDTSHQRRKLLLADWAVPSAAFFGQLDGPRWRPTTMPGRDDPFTEYD